MIQGAGGGEGGGLGASAAGGETTGRLAGLSPPCGSRVLRGESSFSLKPGPVCLSLVEDSGSATHPGRGGECGEGEGLCFQTDLSRDPSRKEEVVCFLGAWRSHRLKEKYAFGGVFWKTGVNRLGLFFFFKNLISH